MTDMTATVRQETEILEKERQNLLSKIVKVISLRLFEYDMSLCKIYLSLFNASNSLEIQHYIGSDSSFYNCITLLRIHVV